MLFGARRWRLQFALSSLFVLVTLFGVWFGIHAIRIRQQAVIVKEVYASGGIVVYDYQKQQGRWIEHPTLPGNPTLRRLLGDNYAADVTQVIISDAPLAAPKNVTDNTAARLSQLRKVWWFQLMDTSITDAGLKNFYHHPSVQRIDLTGSSVTAAGAAAFHKAMPECAISFGDGELIDPQWEKKWAEEERRRSGG